MPQQIEIPGQGVLEFPDEFSDDQIKAVIKRKFPQQPATLPDPRQATALEVPRADLFPTQFQSEAQVPSSLTYAALDKQAAPEAPRETSTLREFGKEFTQIPPEIKQRAREMTERTQRLMQELGPEEYRQKVHDVATRFDAAIKQVDPDSEGAAERRDKLWQMRTAALEELGVDTLRANELPKLSREQAATLIGPQHPRLANILSTGQQIASGLAEGFLESPAMFSKGFITDPAKTAGAAIGKAFVGTMTVDIGKNLVLAEEAYRKGDVEAGDSYLAQAGGTAALMGIPHAAAKFDTLRAEANQIRDRARAQAWALSFGAGGPPAETAMVRTSQKVLQPDQPETVLLREVRPTPPVEPGPLTTIPPPDLPITTGGKDAIQERSATPVHVDETPKDSQALGARVGTAEEPAVPQKEETPTPAAPVGQQTLPPVPKGQQIIQIERPDGSRYTAVFAGYLDEPTLPLHQRMQVGRLKGDGWSHGFLQPDEKVVDSTGPIPTFDEWKAQQPAKEPLPEPAPQPTVEEGTARTSTVPSGEPEKAATEVEKATSLTAEPGEIPGGTVPPIPETSSLIERAMNLVRTRRLEGSERNALGREIENARLGNPQELWKLVQSVERFAEYLPGKEPKEEAPSKPEVPKGGLTEQDGLLFRISQIGKLPAFFPPGWMMSAYTRLLRKQRGGGILSPKEREQFNSLMESFPMNFEDDYGVGGEAMKAAYNAAKEAGIAGELFDVTKSGRNLRLGEILETLKRETGREWKARDLFNEVERIATERLSRVTEGDVKEEALNKEAERQVNQSDAFNRDTKKSAKGTITFKPNELSELVKGSEFTLKGTRLRVTEIYRDDNDNITHITLDDGNKYGTQPVEGEATLRMDEGSLKHPEVTEGEAEFLPKEEAPTGGFPKHPDLPESAKPGSDIFADYHEALTEWENKVREWLKKKPENKAIIWEQDNGNVYTITRNVGEKPWRVTSFVPNKEGNALLPYGHREYATREAAIFEEGQNAKVFHDEMPKPVLTEKEIYGWKEMADIPDKSKLVWYSLKGGADARHDLSMRMRGTTYMQEFVKDSITDDGRVAFTAEIPDKDLDYLGLSKTDKTTPPKLRTGEKAGELFQAADQPFNLAGEKGIDAERLAKEKAEADRKAAEKKAFDEAHAQELPKKEEAGPPLARAIEIEKKFGLGPADAHFFNVALDAVAAAPEKWTTLAEGVQKEAMRAAIAAGGELSKTGDLQLAKRIASEYLTEAPPPKPEEGKAPDGTRIRNFVKENGRWWSIKEDGTKNILPANRPTSRKLEAEAALPPAPPETRTPIQIINQAKQIRVKLPEGATVLRAYNAKGGKADIFIADLNKGDNVLRASDIVRIEAGIKNKKGEFQKVEGDIQVSEYKPGAIDKAIAALNAAKIKKTKGAGSGESLIQIIPGVTVGDAQRIWNAAMDIGIAALKAGKTVAEAIEAAIEHLRSAAISYGSSFDETMARQRLKQVMEPGPTGAMIRTPEELAKQKEFGVKPAVRTVGAYSDIARLKDQEAQALGLSDRARRLLSLPNQMELAARGLSESAGIENYKEASAAVENATPDVKWGVVRDALHSMGFEQRRSIKLKEMYEKQRALVSSPGFQNKMSRLAQREWEAEVRTQKEQTFKNVLAVKAAEFLAKLEQKKVDDAESEMLRDNLKQARQLQDYALAVGMEMDNIVSVVYPNYWEFGRANKNGKDFTTLYLAVKAGQGEPVTDPQRLALVRLAAEVLAINDNLTTRLVWMEQMKQEPDFAQAVNDFGKAFSKRMEQDPSRAIKELVEKQAGLSKRAAQARQAFLALNRDTMAQLERFSDHEAAVAVDERVRNSDEWRALENQVNEDAQSERVPDEIRKDAKAGDIFFEYTGVLNKRDPTGAFHEIKLGFTKADAAQAQEKIGGYLSAVRDWLMAQPENHPDRKYWQQQYDLVDAVYNTQGVLNPGSVRTLGASAPLFGAALKHSWQMPEFLHRQAALPAAKVTQTAFENYHRALMQGYQWGQGFSAPNMRRIDEAKIAHGMKLSEGNQPYREEVLNALAWEYRHGNAVKAGDVLFGVEIKPQDIAALNFQGENFNRLATGIQKNIGAERVMPQDMLLDEFMSGVFGVRRMRERAARPDMMVPRDISRERLGTLSTKVHEIGVSDYAKLTDLFNSELYFKPFVWRWIGQRAPEFAKLSPFEPLFKELRAKMNDPNNIGKSIDDLKSVESIIDFIDRNTDETYNKDSITQHFVGEMAAELEKNYQNFIHKDPNDFSDVRIERATKDGPFTQAYQRDIGSSFYYDFGFVNHADVLSTVIDSSAFYLRRYARSLESLTKVMGDALNEFRATAGHPKMRRELMKKNRQLFRSGDEYRDYRDLEGQLSEVQYYLKNVPIWSHQGVGTFEMLRNFYRLSQNAVAFRLSGWKTLFRVIGSYVKQGIIFQAAERFQALSYAKAGVSMAMSTFNILAAGPVKIVGRRLGLIKEFEGQLSGLAEEMYRSGHYFDEQYRIGLGFKIPTWDQVVNNIRQPYSHGQGYDPRLSDLWIVRAAQKGFYRTISTVPFLEPLAQTIRAVFPTSGYAINYDSVARQAHWMVKTLQNEAIRHFDYYEKMGGLGRFDLANPKSLKNVLRPSDILPRGVLPPTQTNVNLIREMFKRGTDIDLYDAIISYYARMAETPKGERGKWNILNADARPGQDIEMLSRNRMAQIASVALFDIHHASPANRPWGFRASALGRLGSILLGWAAHSARSFFGLLGRAPNDPQMSQAMLTATTAVTVLAALGISTLFGDAEKRVFDKLAWWIDKQVLPTRHLGEGRNAKEEAQIAISDATTYIAVLNSMFNGILGEQSNRGQFGVQIFTLDELNSWLRYISGIVHTGDPTYGAKEMVAREMPLAKVILNRLPSREGTVALNNARTLIQKGAPPELIRQASGGFGMPVATEMTPIKQALANAIYRNDAGGVAQYYEALRQKAVELGRPDPDRLVANVMRSLNPYSLALVGHPTELQRQTILDGLTPEQRQMLLDAETNYMAAAQSVGVQSEMVRKEPGTPGERAPAAAGGGGRVALPVGGGGGAVGAIRTPSVGAGRMGMGRRISLGRSSGAGRLGRAGTTRVAHYTSGRLKPAGSRGRRLSYASLVGRGTRAGRKFSIRRPKARRVRRVRLYA